MVRCLGEDDSSKTWSKKSRVAVLLKFSKERHVLYLSLTFFLKTTQWAEGDRGESIYIHVHFTTSKKCLFPDFYTWDDDMSGEASPMELTRFVELLRASSSSVHIHRGRTKNILEGSNNYYQCRWDLAEWLERLAVSVKVATVLGSIRASPAQQNRRGGRWSSVE